MASSEEVSVFFSLVVEQSKLVAESMTLDHPKNFNSAEFSARVNNLTKSLTRVRLRWISQSLPSFPAFFSL
jgi:hypothetical protein